MQLAGRKALLTGRHRRPRPGDRPGARRPRRDAAAQLAQGGRAASAGRRLPGDGHRVLPADLAEPGAAERLAAEAAEVDVLVANAGLPGAGWLTDFSPEEVGRALRVNLEAPMLLAQALYPGMLERGAGHLVFVSSLAGKAASPRSSIYNATKFGLRGFALGLRTDLAAEGRRRLAGLAGLHPRRRHVRRLRRQDAAGPRHRDPRRRSAPRCVKAVEHGQGRDRRRAAASTASPPTSASSAPASPSAPRAGPPARRPRKRSPPATPRTRKRQEIDPPPGRNLPRHEQRFVWRPFDPRGERARV